MKCKNCGTEFTGKFCTNCGAPAQTNPVCANCGAEITGNFCMKCGAPAPKNETQPVQNEPAQQTEFVSETAPEQGQIPQPVHYNENTDGEQNPANPYQTGFEQQTANSSNGQFDAQQFTYQPQNNAPAGKKPMSNGKIAAIIISVVAGLFLILCIIVGVVACNVINASKDIVTDLASKASSFVSDVEDYTLPDWLEDISDDDETADPESSSSDYDDYYGWLDSDSGFHYIETDGGVKITEYDNDYDYDSKTVTVEVPSKIDGKDVVEIESLKVYNLTDYDNDDVFIKVIIPGSVKVIDGYAFAFNEDIDEVVIENGVKTIESDAFFDCKTLKSVTVPESVKHMEYCGIGIEYDDDEIDEIAIEGFTLYGKKGSTAESYAKENKLKFAESK